MAATVSVSLGRWKELRVRTRGLTDEVEEGEADEEVGGPVETAAEGKGSAPDLGWVDLAEDKPGH